MNKKLITMGLISGTVMFTGIGIVFPELSVGIGCVVMGGTSLGFALHVLKESARRKIDKMILEELR
ncbi:MAG TPA: hypothetical protein VJL78_05320 [Candidatus Nitrosocosmicus sp.]|jgi:hypothetical protein|nr:hypothetical protein [Candidatus Nitrosocosmicus sp.]